jgi:hypothetical protein
VPVQPPWKIFQGYAPGIERPHLLPESPTPLWSGGFREGTGDQKGDALATGYSTTYTHKSHKNPKYYPCVNLTA